MNGYVQAFFYVYYIEIMRKLNGKNLEKLALFKKDLQMSRKSAKNTENVYVHMKRALLR